MAKVISIITTVTLLSVGFWITAEPWINSTTKFADWHVWIWPLCMLTLLASATSLAYMLLPKRRIKLLLAGFIGLGYLAVFGLYYLDIIAFFTIPLFHLFAIRNIQLETQERIKVHPGQIIKRGVGMVLLPIFIALSFAYFLSPSIQIRAQNADLAPNLKDVVREVADKFLQGEFSEGGEVAKEHAVERAYDYFLSYFEPYREYFPPMLAFGLFLILWGLGFIMNRLSVWIGIILFWILRKSHFISIEHRQVDAETIVLQNVNLKMQSDSSKL